MNFYTYSANNDKIFAKFIINYVEKSDNDLTFE